MPRKYGFRGTLIVLLILVASGAGSTTSAQATVQMISHAATTSGDVPLPGTPRLLPATPAYAMDPLPADASYTPEALYATQGDQPVKDCIVDSGINETPTDTGKVVANYNMNDGGNYAPDQTENRHGTHVASETVSKAPNTLIINVKVTTNAFGYSTNELAAAGIRKCVDVGAQVINFSMIAGSDSSEVNSAIDNACNANIPVVIAAGNEATNSPADNYFASDNYTKPCVITVGGYDPEFNRVNPSSDYGSWVGIAAPWSVLVQGENSIDRFDQTSIAAPQVVGTIDQMKGLPGKANMPVDGPGGVKDCIVNHSTPIKTTPPGGPTGALNDWGAIKCASYQPPTGTVNVVLKGRGHVTDQYNLIDCPGTCSATIYGNTPDELTEFPVTGWKFAGWSSKACGKRFSCTVTSGDPAVTALFVRKTQIKVTVVGMGMIVGTGIRCGGGEVRCLSSPSTSGVETFNAKPQTKPIKWRFVHWTGACKGTQPKCTLNIATGPAMIKFGALFARA